MISVIIPTLNNQDCIAQTIAYLKQNAYTRLVGEIIVVDFGSRDKTAHEAERAGARVYRNLRKNRAGQLNHAAQRATGEILMFLNPGLLPEPDFACEIVRMYNRKSGMAVFRKKSLAFPMHCLGILANRSIRFARMEEQALIVVKELFIKGGQFSESARWPGCELIQRLRRYAKTEILSMRINGNQKANIPKAHQEGAMIVTLIGLGVSAQFLMRLEEGVSKATSAFMHPLQSITRMLPHIRLHQSRVR